MIKQDLRLSRDTNESVRVELSENDLRGTERFHSREISAAFLFVFIFEITVGFGFGGGMVVVVVE